MVRDFWLSCNKFTIWCQVKDTIIVNTSSITHKFIGQPLNNLIKWMIRFGGFRQEELKRLDKKEEN